MRQCQRQRSGTRCPAGGRARPHLTDVVLVFGDVGEVREIAEGAHDAHGLADRHAVEDEFELMPGRPVVVPVEADRGLPDAFDQIEYVGTFLIAHGVAQDTPEQANIVPQPGVLLQRLRIFVAIGPQFGIRRHDLGRHRRLLQKLPGNPQSAIFLPQRKIKIEAVLRVDVLNLSAASQILRPARSQ